MGAAGYSGASASIGPPGRTPLGHLGEQNPIGPPEQGPQGPGSDPVPLGLGHSQSQPTGAAFQTEWMQLCFGFWSAEVLECDGNSVGVWGWDVLRSQQRSEFQNLGGRVGEETSKHLFRE